MEPPDIALFYNEGLPSEMFEEFKTAIARDELKLLVQPKPDEGPMACEEWFIPTAVMAFIGASYFGTIFKEMGKDHYALLKEKLAGVATDVMKKPRIEPVILGTPGKVSENNPYTLGFSIYAEANDGNRFKLLLPKPHDTVDYTEIVYTFMEYLNNFHLGIYTLSDIGFDDSKLLPAGHIFVHMNLETKNIEWLDASEYR